MALAGDVTAKPLDARRVGMVAMTTLAHRGAAVDQRENALCRAMVHPFGHIYRGAPPSTEALTERYSCCDSVSDRRESPMPVPCTHTHRSSQSGAKASLARLDTLVTQIERSMDEIERRMGNLIQSRPAPSIQERKAHPDAR